jgi:hypothetical protein
MTDPDINTESDTNTDFAADGEVEASADAAHNPAMLAELTRAALPFLGPYSITTVQRVSRETTDAKALVKGIATHIENLDKRQHFLLAGKRIVRQHVPLTPTVMTTVSNVSRSDKTKPEHIEQSARATTAVTPELVHRGEIALAKIIGPLAGLLAARYASAASAREFYERLASHLRTPEERDSFYLEVHSGRDRNGM